MKLFITNQREFKEQFDSDFDTLYNLSRNVLNSSEIHKRAFSILKKSIDLDHSIPIGITTNYDDGEGIVVFIFVNKKDDVYYYEFSGTAS